MYKTKYAPLHHSRTYTNVYIGIRSTSMSKEKGRDLTQSYDKSPYTNRNVKRAK